MLAGGRLVGIIVAVVGIIIWVIGGLVVATSVMSAEGGTPAGLVLGLAIVMIVGLPFVVVGIFLLIRGKAEVVEMEDAARQRKILDMVKTRGQVDISDLVFELNSNADQVRDDIYRLVGLGLFTGYVNWDDGVLYSVEASKLRGNKCPNCGGEMSLAGKGVITCTYCGADVFL